jgi:phosphonopyruvate decarboxylase
LGRRFLELLERHGYDFFTGVPCSLFKTLTRELDDDPRFGYVSAVREDAALGLAAGAYLGGRQPVVLMQNSGLGVSVNALVSLHQIYDIPTLMLISWRGQDGHDAPEHLVMGSVMTPLLDLMAIPYEVLDAASMEQQVSSITTTMRRSGRPVALVVPKGVFDR